MKTDGGRRPAGTGKLEDVLRAALDVLAPLRTALPASYETISTLLGDAAHERLRIGVVGVTSSGKSTFINALLGESLLPEQSKATTNLPVICRKGQKRKLSVYFADSTSEELNDDSVKQEVLRSLCAEDENPGNAKNIARLELDVPTCCLSDELEVIDTPGTDAYGLPKHEEVTLRRCLSMADIVVFMTQSRREFARSDAQLLTSIIDNDQRVLFVISHADIERDEYEGGRLIRSRQEKLGNHVRNLERDLKRYPRLREFGIVAVSSQFAKEARGDRTSTAWRDSNFDAVLKCFQQYASDLSAVLTSSRLEHTRAVLMTLKSTVLQLASPLAKKSQISPDEEVLVALVKRYLETEKQLRRHIAKVQDDVVRAMDVRRLQVETKAELANLRATDIAGFSNAMEHLAKQWQIDTEAHTRKLDLARKECRESLQSLNLPTGRKAVTNRLLHLPSFPVISGSIVRQEETYTVSLPRPSFFGKIWDGLFGVRTQQRRRTYDAVDRATLKRELESFLSSAANAFTAFIREECRTVTELYIDPVQNRREEDERRLNEFRSIRTNAATDLTMLPLLAEDLQELLLQLPDRAHEAKAATVVRSAFAEPSPGDQVRPRSAGPTRSGAAAVRKMLARAWESVAIARFWRTAEIAVHGDAVPESVFLVVMERPTASRLIALLTRSRAEALLHPDDDSGRPLDVTIDHRNGRSRVFGLDARGAVAPAALRAACEGASAIAVEIEAAHVSAGLKRLIEAPAFPILQQFEEKLFFVADEGAYFDTHLQDLVTEVVPLVSKATGFVRAPWFVCESSRYDARYSDFIELAVHVHRAGGASRDLIRQWREEHLSMRAPFEEDALNKAFALIAAFREERVR